MRYYTCGFFDCKHNTVEEAWKCQKGDGSVRALTWAFGDFTVVGLTSNERVTLSKLTNPGWWDRHYPKWRRISAEGKNRNG